VLRSILTLQRIANHRQVRSYLRRRKKNNTTQYWALTFNNVGEAGYISRVTGYTRQLKDFTRCPYRGLSAATFHRLIGQSL